jgi:hypothetical protein
MDTWDELSADVLSGTEYTNAKRGWRNTETGAEVIVFRVEGTGLEDVTDSEWAVQHPADKYDEHTYFFDSKDAAENYAGEYIRDHARPVNQH